MIPTPPRLTLKLLCLFFLGLITLTTQERNSQADTPSPSPSSHLNLLDPDIRRSLDTLPRKKVTVQNDPTYGGDQHYEGYEIKPFLSWLSSKTGVPVTDAVMTFTATDGYMSQLAVKDIPDRLGILAFREEGGSANKPFRDSLTTRVPYNPGPFYLVWDGPFSDKHHPPTPWGIISVKLTPNDIPSEHIPPVNSPTIMKGMQLWRTNCSKCHSMNKVGGTMGPELNVPKNVTEYWDHQHLKELIGNPASLRWGSKMPGFAWLPADDRDAILAYMESMKEKKVCSSEASCNKTP